MSSSAPYSKVVVIVVTYNGSRWVHPCMTSLKASKFPVRVIVVDNNSTDDTVAIIEKFYPEVTLVKSKDNLGFGKANNKGLQIALDAGADFFFLLNQDAWIEENTIGTLVRAFEQEQHYGIISPVHYNGTGEKIDNAFRQYLVTAGCATDPVFLSATSAHVHALPFVNAAAWMLDRSCLEQVGGFGYLFTHYGEDRDYVQRAKYFGLKVGFVTGCKIFHDRDGRAFDLSKLKRMIWYYYTGSLVRSADINKRFVPALLYVLGWLLKDTLYHVLALRLHAVPACFSVVAKLISSLPAIQHYRLRIKGASRFRFLVEDESI